MSESSFELVQSFKPILADLRQKTTKCQVCGSRRGDVLMARYRLKAETTQDIGRNIEILKEIRSLRICGWCIHKVENGVEHGMSNGNITVEEILWENETK